MLLAELPFPIGISALFRYDSTIVFPIQCTVKQILYNTQCLAACKWFLDSHRGTLATYKPFSGMETPTYSQLALACPWVTALILLDFDTQKNVSRFRLLEVVERMQASRPAGQHPLEVTDVVQPYNFYPKSFPKHPEEG